tara:strand:- start:273 stop:560 length:288 start_codon:yes stop_codon:yes gene_type:complete
MLLQEAVKVQAHPIPEEPEEAVVAEVMEVLVVTETYLLQVPHKVMAAVMLQALEDLITQEPEAVELLELAPVHQVHRHPAVLAVLEVQVQLQAHR